MFADYDHYYHDHYSHHHDQHQSSQSPVFNLCLQGTARLECGALDVVMIIIRAWISGQLQRLFVGRIASGIPGWRLTRKMLVCLLWQLLLLVRLAHPHMYPWLAIAPVLGCCFEGRRIAVQSFSSCEEFLR